MSFILRFHPQCNPFCNGCSHKHLSLKLSRQNKFHYIQQILSSFTHNISEIETHTSDAFSFGYRKKVILHAYYSKSTWIFGLKHNDTIIPIHDCPLHDPVVNCNVTLLSYLLPPAEIFPLVYLLINHKQLVFVLKTRKDDFRHVIADDIIEAIRNTGIEGIHLHFHPSAGLKVFGKAPLITIYGNSRSKDDTGYWYEPRSFMQPIGKLAIKAYRSALAFLISQQQNLILFDLYCGRGLMSAMFLAEGGSLAYGVESDIKTIEVARSNVPERATFLPGLVEQRIHQLNDIANRFEPDQIVVFTNPSRKGMGKIVCNWLSAQLQPYRIAYLSCNPLSLRDDLHILSSSYHVIDIIPFDFFPWTHHIECLVLLKRK